MKETVKTWLDKLHNEAIEEAKETIKNERILELGYDGEDVNPHTKNIKALDSYIESLEVIKTLSEYVVKTVCLITEEK